MRHHNVRRFCLRSVWLLGTVCVGLCSGEAGAQQRFDDLLSRIPPGANALMVIDVPAVHRSAIAQRERWSDLHEAAFTTGPLVLPPEATRLVLASQLDANEGLVPSWELAVMSSKEPISMRSIARSEGGYLDVVRGVEAAWTPSDAYIVALGGDVLAVMNPANRQSFSRWLEFTQSNTAIRVSPYLKAAAGEVNPATQIVLAFDLTDVVAPHRLRERLKTLELTRDDAAKQLAWETVIRALEGLTLQVHLGESARGSLRIDFAVSPATFGSEAKPLVLAALDQFGVGIQELDTWDVKLSVEKQSIELNGALSNGAMRKVFSLLQLPSTKFSTLKDAPANDNSAQTGVAASQSYFKSVSTLLDDIRKEFQTNRDARNSLAPVYMERYAKNIDRLPILNVDEELLAYGAAVAETLRSVSVDTRMANVRTGVRKSQVYGNYVYNYDDNGYYSGRTTASVKTQIEREEQAAARQTRFGSWKEIEDATAAIRNAMTRKYMVEF